MKLVLIRTYHPNGTNGELLLDGDRLCSTIELPWKNNEPQVSCISEGEYELIKRYSQRFGEHFILMNVPERSYILMHPANDALKELKGLIRPEKKPGHLLPREKENGRATPVCICTGFIFNR